MSTRLRTFLPFAIRPIGITLAVVLAGCSTVTTESATSAAKAVPGARHTSPTLADLENAEIVLDHRAVEERSIESALENYKQAAWMSSNPGTRAESMQRIADLSMTANEVRESNGTTTQPRAMTGHSQGAGNKPAPLNRDIDVLLVRNFTQGASDATTSGEADQMLELAGNIMPGLDGDEGTDGQETAIQLYRAVIARSEEPAAKAEAYYMLAKALDFGGRSEESRSTLKELCRLYPDSPFFIEAQFRLGEAYFSDGEFDLAAQAYGEVIHAGDTIAYYEQSIYKRGWSYYKVSDYDRSLADFMRLIEFLEKLSAAHGKVVQTDSQMLADAYRVAALAFNNLEGHKSITHWFSTSGHHPYEYKLYQALGDLYIRGQRYLDAAESFEAYTTIYPDSDLAPELSSKAIQALQDGGFPTQVLPAKERFVINYGVESDYWRHHEKQRLEYLPLLKSHLLDLARYYHSQAQRTGDASVFLVAAGWYQQLMKTDPDDTLLVTLNQSYAEALFSGRDLVAATREFDRTAYSYEGYGKAAEAGYLGLLARQEIMDEIRAGRLSGIDSNKIREEKINAGLRFAQSFPSHPKLANVLQNIIEDQLARKDISGAVQSAKLLVSMEPEPKPDLLKYGWQTIAEGQLDLGNFKESETAYKKVLASVKITSEERKKINERLAESIYRQGEKLASSGMQLEAAAEFLRVSNLATDSMARTTAEFDAATIYLKMGQWELAIPVLENFRTRYPNHALSDTVPDKLALAYEKTGRWAAAAHEMELIHDKKLKTEPELARSALWQAAELTEKTANEDELIRLYTRYQALHSRPLEPAMEAQYRMVKLQEKRDDLKNRDAMLLTLSTSARNAGQEATVRTNYLGAYASLALAEPVFQRFAEYKLKLPLKNALTEKRRLMQAALDAYATTARFGVAEFASAAQYRTAEIYRILAADIMTSERPRGLDELALEQYALLLEEQALPFEDQAIDIYVRNAGLVGQGIYDQWVKKSFKALAALQPGRYGKAEQVENHVDNIY